VPPYENRGFKIMITLAVTGMSSQVCSSWSTCISGALNLLATSSGAWYLHQPGTDFDQESAKASILYFSLGDSQTSW